MGRVFNNNPPAIGDLYLLSPISPEGALFQLTDVAAAGGGVIDPEVSYDGERVVFSMRESSNDSWHIWEMNLDGSNLHQITFNPPHLVVNDQDPDYLPDGRIVFASDRLKQREMKPYDQAVSTQLYTVNADGSDLRQIDYNANFDINPQVARNGQILFDRWDHLNFMRNLFTLWRMNTDGTNGFVYYGGVSPRFNQQGGENANALESRELATGELVGIFTQRDSLAGKMAIFDPRSFNLENLPFPLPIGPTTGFYRTPYPLTDTELIYSYTPDPAPQHNGFGLYTMQLTPEAVLVDDATSSTAPGPGVNPTFRTYNIELSAAGRIYIEVSGITNKNFTTPDRAWVRVDGVDYDGGTQDIERKLDGSLTFGKPYSYRIDFDLPAGPHTINIATDVTPTITHVRIVRAIAATNHTVLYDDPATNEVSPIPVRVRNLPPTYPSQSDDNLNWGTFVVRDVSLRGDFRQVNFNGAGGDPNYPYHMDLGEIDGLRIKQNLSRRSETQDILVGASFFDPVRVIGVATPNATGTVAFKTLAGVTTAWDLIDEDGGALVHERVWSWVQPGEVRSCNGCHVGAFPYEPRAIGAIPSAQDLRQRGEVYTFVDQVLPILQDECDGCHTGQNPAGGLNLKGDRTTFDALLAYVGNRTPTQYAINGEARFSFLYQLLSGRVNINPEYTARLNQINNQVNHTFMLSSSELYDIATWLDMGAGFAYLPLGFQSGDPDVVSVLPAHNANGVRRDTGVAVHFDAPIDRATVNSSTFVLRRSNGQTISGTWEWGTNNDVFFRPYSNLPTGQYELTISGNILDIENALPGSPLGETFISNFSVVNSYDNSDPDVAEFLPDNNANPFAIVTVVFDEPIDPGSVNDYTFTVVDSKGFYVDGRITVSANGLEASWIPWAPFNAGETYEVRLSSGIRDLARNYLDAVTFHFTVATTSAPQYHSQIAAVPTDVDPKRMAINQDGTEFLVANKYSNLVTRYEVGSWDVLANYPVAAGPTDVAYSADDARAYVLNTVANNVQIINLSNGDVMATISDGLVTPDWLLPDHEGSRLYVSDIGGTGYIHEIDVVLGSPTFGQVLRTFNLGKIPARPTISADDQTIYFGSSLAFNILDVATGSVTHSIALTYGTVGPVILAPDESYALAPSTTGGTLRYIDLLLKQDRGVIVLPDDADHLAFSPNGNFLYLILRTTQSLAIMDVDTWQVVAELVGANAEDTFIQSLVTSPDGQLVFTVAGGLATEVLVYQVADPNDVTPPTVTGFMPANGSTDQPVHVPIEIVFSEPIDRLTLNAGNFTITDSSGASVPGRIEVQLQGTAVDFVPDTVLLPDQTYTVSLSSGVRDLSGNNLTPFAYSFTTVGIPTATYHGQITAIPTRVDPKRMALNAAGTEFLVANKYDNLVTRHAVGTWETLASYPVAAGPFDVVYSANGTQAYVLNTVAKNVQILNLNTGQILFTIGAPLITPDRLLLNHAGTRLYVSDIGGSGAIHEIDVVADSITFGDVLRTFDLERIPAPPVISANDAYLYFGSPFAFNTLDIASAQISNSIYIPYGTVGPVAISPNGAYAVAPSLSSKSLRLIDLTIQQDRSQITLPDNVDHMAFSPDGRFLYLVLRTTQNLAVMDTASLQIVSELPTFQVPSTFVQGLAVSPDSGGGAPGRIFAVAGGLATSVLAFEVADPNDVTPPSVAGFTPADGSSDQPVHAPIQITFSERVDRLTLNAGNFTITDSSGAPVDGRIYPHLSGTGVDFLPTALLTPGESYTVSLSSGVRDVSGNSLAAFAYSFMTTDAATSLYHGQRVAVPTRIDPKRLALNNAGTEFLVAGKYENMVTRYAVGSWETIASYPVAAGPYDVAYSTDDARAYVLNTTAKNVQILDLSTGQVLVTIGAPLMTPDRLLVNHAGTRLYVSDIAAGNAGGTGYIHEIDVVVGSPTFGQVLRTFNLGRVPSAPVISPDDARLYFGSPSAFNTLNIATGQISNSLYLPYGTVGPVALSPDGSYALAPSLSAQSLRLIDLNIQQDRAEIALPDNVDHMAFSPDGRFLYLVLRVTQNLAIMDTATLQIVAELPTAQPVTTVIQSLTVSPDSRQIFAVAGGLATSTLVFEPADPNDITVPTVANVTPANGNDSVPLTASVRVAFSEPLDRLTLHGSTFSLLNSSGNPVNGSIVINPNGLEAHFLPTTLLAANETYTVSLTSDVRDLSGNSLPAYAASFTTVSGPVDQYHAQLAAFMTDIDPKRMAVNNAGTEILVANKYNNLVTRYAIGSWAELARYPVGLNPYDVAFSANDALAYVLNTGDKSVQFLDLSDGTILHTTTGFSTPDRLRLNHGGDRLYVNDTSGTGAIYELDAVLGSPTFGQILRTFNVGKVPSRPIVSLDDQYLYFGSPLAFNILDITTGVIVASFPLPYGSVGPVAVTPDGSFAFVPSSNTKALRRIDLNLRLDRGEMTLPDNPDNMVFSPDGRFLYMIMRTTQDLAVMDVATLQIVANLPADGNDTTAIQSLAISPNSQYIFAVAGGAAEQILVYQPGDMNDIIAPTVTGITPGNAANLPVYAPISAVFSEPLDRLTINASNIWLDASGAPQDGALHISPDNQTVQFAPALLLQPLTSYTLHLEHTLADLAGNTLGLAQTATFTTAATLDPGPLNLMSQTFNSNGSRGLAMSPDGSLLAVANRLQNSVSLLEPNTMQPIRVAIPVSAGPRGLAFNSDGSRLYVVTNPGNTLVEIDVSAGQVIRTIANVLANEEVVISPDGSRAYATGFNNNVFQQIDLATGAITAPLGAVDKPGRPAYAPDGTLYLATNNTLWRQNGDGSWTAINTNSSYTIDVAFSADSRYAFLAQTWRDALLVVDLWQDAPLVEVPLGDEPRQMAQSADGRFLFVSNKTSATVQIVDTMTLAVVREASLPGSQMLSVAWDEAGQRLFVTDTTNNVVRGFSLNHVAPPPVIRNDSSYELQFNQWAGVVDANALGGGYRATSAASQWISYKSPATTEFNLITYMGPDQGKAYIKVDGVTISTLDLYAPTPQYQAVFTFANLTNAPHNIMVTAAGQQNPASTGTEVRVDGFVVNGQTVDDNALSLNYQGWSSLSGAWATNGAARLATTPGNSATFTVNGDAFIWRTATCPTCGQAEIQVDGNVLTMVDLYSPAWQVQYGQLISGLGSGSHQITITILSTKNPASGGTLVILDGYSHPSP
ncbi:MAG: hypothetical protein Fur0021_05590 [Candidatus Promineifilaceae bacterium]